MFHGGKDTNIGEISNDGEQYIDNIETDVWQ